jgi:Tfp pilus assembly protein PilE
LKNKNDGFTSIECVVSLSIICILVYMVSVSLYNNYFVLNNNISKIEMTNIAKSTLDYIKDSIRNNNISSNYNDTETINNYEVKKTIEKDEYYYKCYKVVIEVRKNEQIRRLESYVLQQ